MGKKLAKNRYSDKELLEFEELIKDKLGYGLLIGNNSNGFQG